MGMADSKIYSEEKTDLQVRFMKKFFDMNNKYIGWGITAFVVIACAIVFYMLLHYVGSVIRVLSWIIRILSPFIWGAIIAYILAPSIDWNEEKIFACLNPDGSPSPWRRSSWWPLSAL